MMNPYVLLAAVAFWLASMAGAGWLARDYTQGEYAKDELTRKSGWADALEATAAEIAKIKVTNRTINTQAETIIREKTILTECKNPPEMVTLINQAAKGGAK